jgi:hypothetical protein
MAKYIKLFEDYSKEKSEGWSTIRDAIQMRLPFAIIVFKKKSSYLDALDSGELDSDYIKQTAVLHTEGKPTDYPSIFMVVEDDEVFKNKIPNIFNSFNIKAILLGKKSEEDIMYYSENGNSRNIGNELVSTIQKDEMGSEDHFEIGSTYYRFVEFADR